MLHKESPDVIQLFVTDMRISQANACLPAYPCVRTDIVTEEAALADLRSSCEEKFFTCALSPHPSDCRQDLQKGHEL